MVLLPRNGMATVVGAKLKNDRQNKKSLIISDFSRLFCDPFGIQNSRYHEIILKCFAL